MKKAERADAKPKHTRQPVVVVDLDGCLVANPREAMKARAGDQPVDAIIDVNYWERHWNNPMGSVPHYELVNMVRTLQIAGWKVYILTARPETFRTKTEQFLRRIELDCALIMRSGTDIIPSAEWKAEVISHMIDVGYDVKLMIEDYKPNADAVRHLVPVLLYERKRSK